MKQKEYLKNSTTILIVFGVVLILCAVAGFLAGSVFYLGPYATNPVVQKGTLGFVLVEFTFLLVGIKIIAIASWFHMERKRIQDKNKVGTHKQRNKNSAAGK